MTKKNLVLFFLIAVMISACDLRPFPPIDKVSPQEIKTPTPPLIDSEKISPTGFYWPTGGTPIILQKWLAHGCDESGTYFDGSYHIGLDIDAQVGDPVYSISPGRVIRISPGGWGLTNKAAIIQHFLKDGLPFLQFTVISIQIWLNSKKYWLGRKLERLAIGPMVTIFI